MIAVPLLNVCAPNRSTAAVKIRMKYFLAATNMTYKHITKWLAKHMTLVCGWTPRKCWKCLDWKRVLEKSGRSVVCLGGECCNELDADGVPCGLCLSRRDGVESLIDEIFSDQPDSSTQPQRSIGFGDVALAAHKKGKDEASGYYDADEEVKASEDKASIVKSVLLQRITPRVSKLRLLELKNFRANSRIKESLKSVVRMCKRLDKLCDENTTPEM